MRPVRRVVCMSEPLGNFIRDFGGTGGHAHSSHGCVLPRGTRAAGENVSGAGLYGVSGLTTAHPTVLAASCYVRAWRPPCTLLPRSVAAFLAFLHGRLRRTGYILERAAGRRRTRRADPYTRGTAGGLGTADFSGVVDTDW